MTLSVSAARFHTVSARFAAKQPQTHDAALAEQFTTEMDNLSMGKSLRLGVKPSATATLPASVRGHMVVPGADAVVDVQKTGFDTGLQVHRDLETPPTTYSLTIAKQGKKLPRKTIRYNNMMAKHAALRTGVGLHSGDTFQLGATTFTLP